MFFLSKRIIKLIPFIYVLSLTMPFITLWSIDNASRTGIILLWSFLTTGLAFISSKRTGIAITILFLVFTIVTPVILIDQKINELSNFFIYGFYGLNLAGLVLIGINTFCFINTISSGVEQYFNTKASELAGEKAKDQKLLSNLLPDIIAQRLKEEESMIADYYESVTVLFTDIVGFTKLAATMDTRDLVDILNVVFSSFDQLAENHGLEKIKTMGDCYMAGCGIPLPVEKHADKALEMVIEMMAEIRKFNSLISSDLNVRIGLHTGHVVAGVIGRKKAVYDLWGDTVNVASRMESHGIPGFIQISEATFHALEKKSMLEDRGSIQVKGLGEMNTFILDYDSYSNVQMKLF